MRNTINIFILLIICSGTLYSQPTSFESTTANIACWNLSGFYPISREKAKDFAKVIAFIDPEVIALEEVNPDFIVAEIVAELIDLGICYKRSIPEQTASQNIAILYKCNIEFSNPRFVPGSDNNNPSLRKALAADMKIGNFDFILIAVHLKSGRNNSERNIRNNQAQAIANFIQNETTGVEKDVLVIGDYNMIPSSDQSNFLNMNANNFLNFISNDLDGQISHIDDSGHGKLLDGYAISLNHTQEYINGSIKIIPLPVILNLSMIEYRNTISDHLPIDAYFLITSDDDQ